MIITTRNGITLYEFEGLSRHPGVAFAFTGRQGGVSKRPYDSLNLSLNVRDDRGAVAENRRRVASVTGLPLESWVTAQQVHGCGVAAVTRVDRGRGAFDYADGLPDVDALVTNEPELTLTITVADCVPILLFDAGSNAVGLVHAGWNGTVQHVARGTVEAMAEMFGSEPRELLAGIGPSIGPDSYEVGVEVAARAALEYPRASVVNERDGRFFFDLWRATAADLQSAGVSEARIEVASIDSFASEQLFSDRRQRPTGRSMALAALLAQ
jgi:polyphenol oxidase